MNANGRNLVVVGGAIAVDLLFWDGEVRLAGGGELPMWLPVVTTVVAHACLLDRRTRPVAVFVVQAAFAMVSVVVPLWQPVAGLLVATFAIAANTGSRVARWGWLAAVPLIAHAVTQSLWFNSKWVGLLQAGTLYLVAGAACWVAGRRVRARGGQLRAWHAEQERLHTQAALDERVALARELHDGVANTITTVLLQAAAGRAAARGDADLLRGIETTARQAMEEIQHTLQLMPRDARTPQGPTLDDLPNLIELGRATGLDVTHVQTGTPRALDPVASGAVYRTVQEGITNTLKYAPPGTRCLVRLDWGPDQLSIDVIDQPLMGRRLDLPATGGRGLAGLADRLGGLGGAVTSGSHGDGFRLAARVPVGAR
jgi:signal transduction histidine kinase